MFSRVAVLFSFSMMFFMGPLHALGLGEIKLNSYLHQSFDAELMLISVEDDQLASIRVRLADDEQFIRTGIEINTFLRSLEFDLDINHKPNPKITISSPGPVREPFLDFLIQLTWSDGRLVKEYTVLLDPPIIAPSTRVRKAVPATLNAPPTKVKSQPARKLARVSAIDSSDYRLTNRRDTLWGLGQTLRMDDAVSREQMMVALWKENPRAFSKRNMNGLMAGYNLRIPTRESALSVTRVEAMHEISMQHEEWQGDRAQTAERLSAIQASTSGAQLKLLTPSVTPEPQIEAEAIVNESVKAMDVVVQSSVNDDLKQVKEEIAMAIEETETQRQQTEELQMRFTAMEEQIASLHRLIRLKDTELAQLQLQTIQEQAGSSAPIAMDREVEDNDFMDASMMQTLAVMLLALLLIIYFLSKRKAAKVSATQINKPQAVVAPVAIAAVSQTVTTQNDTVSAVDEAQSDDLSTVDRVIDEEAVDESDQSGLDTSLLAEIDLYLAYGNYAQVQLLIDKALEANADNNELRIKLLEMYSMTQDKDAFIQEAKQVLLRLDQQENDPLWTKIKDMGTSIGIDESAYNENTMSSDSASVADFDVISSAPEASSNIASFDIDEDMNTSVADVTEDVSSDEGLEPAREIEEMTLEFKLDSTTTDALAEDEAITSSIADELATKLDLARAYLDMDDIDGAKDLLADVLEKGSEEQKTEATRMLNEVG